VQVVTGMMYHCSGPRFLDHLRSEEILAEPCPIE
jgi:hypothetical protein